MNILDPDAFDGAAILQHMKEQTFELMSRYAHRARYTGVQFLHIGSTAVKGTVVGCNDVDLMVLVKFPDTTSECNFTLHHLEQIMPHWKYGGSADEGHDGDNGQWASYKFPDPYRFDKECNILLTTEQRVFDAWAMATKVSRLMHLSGYEVDKTMRVCIHKVVVDGITPMDMRTQNFN